MWAEHFSHQFWKYQGRIKTRSTQGKTGRCPTTKMNHTSYSTQDFWGAACCAAAAIMSRLFKRCRQTFRESILVSINIAILCFSNWNERLGGGDTPTLLPHPPRTLNPKEPGHLWKHVEHKTEPVLFTAATLHAVRAKLQHKAQNIKILVIGNWSWTHQWEGSSQRGKRWKEGVVWQIL